MKYAINAFLLLALFVACTVSPAEAGEASVLVNTVSLRQDRVISSLTCYGLIAADPRGTASITLSRSIRVSRLLATQGEVVAAGEPLAEVVTDSADTFNYEQAALSVDYARRELGRVKSMTARHLATQSQLAAASKSLDDAEAALREQKSLGSGRSRERLKAPFAGTVTAIAVKEGDRVPAGTALLQISRQGALRAELGVEPEDSSRVRKGMEVLLTPVFDGNKTLKGIVRDIHGVINPQTRLVDVIVSLSGKESATFLAGTQVRGVIHLSRQTAWVVPRQAVLRDSRGDYLYQVDRGRVRRVDVISSRASDGLVTVRGPVNPLLKIVSLGNYELRDGMAVREETTR
jgi:membrane fusion protein (multidrug efflux system)